MDFSKINDHVNPFSKGFSQAKREFNSLTQGQQFVTVALATITGLATIFLVGIGGFATFKALADSFHAKNLKKGTNLTVDKTDLLARKQLLKTLEVLSFEELLEKAKGFPLEEEMLKKGMELNGFEKEVHNSISNRISKMPLEELKKHLNQLKTQPEKFALLASGIMLFSHLTISKIYQFLDECEWPSLDSKKVFLPNLIASLIVIHGFEKDKWESGFIQTGESQSSGFPCYKIALNMKELFGDEEFTLNPIPPYFIQSIGIAITFMIETCQSILKGQLGSDMQEASRIGIEIDLTSLPASMITPLLPFLKKVPGIVSLVLSKEGLHKPWDYPTLEESNNTGFKDEHAEDLLNIFRSHPFLQKVSINIDGMSKEKREAFIGEWTKIWEDSSRFQKPSLENIFLIKQTNL